MCAEETLLIQSCLIMSNKIHYSIQLRFAMCDKETLVEKPVVLSNRFFFLEDIKMREKAIYFAKPDFYELIREAKGQWSDAKERPIVCLIKSSEYDFLYWAIPMGNYDHRDEKGKKRLQSYIDIDDRDIRSCYYHIGKTNVKSIFFISDAVPITDTYIEREYTLNRNQDTPYTIKNPKLISELERKLYRILAYEHSNPNSFRQHITDIKKILVSQYLGSGEIEQDKQLATV